MSIVIGTLKTERGVEAIEWTGENLRVNGEDVEIACKSLKAAVDAAGTAWGAGSLELRLIEGIVENGPEVDPITLVRYAYDEQAEGWHVTTYSGESGERVERDDSEKIMFPVDIDAIEADQEDVLVEELRAAFPSARIERK